MPSATEDNNFAATTKRLIGPSQDRRARTTKEIPNIIWKGKLFLFFLFLYQYTPLVKMLAKLITIPV